MTQDELQVRPAERRRRTLREFSGRIGRAAGRFPVAFALTAIAAVLLVIQSLSSWIDDPSTVASLATWLDPVAMVARGCLAGFPVSVVAQLAAERRGGARLALARQLVAGISVAALVAVAEHAYGGDYALWEMLFLAAFIVPLFLGLWLLYGAVDERALLPVVASGLLFALLLTAVLVIGLIVVYVAFEALVLELPFDLAEPIFIVGYAFAFPAAFLARVPEPGEQAEVPRAWRAIVGYVVFPLCLLLLAVLYLYLARIALTRTMPSGEMNWYGSFALLVYLGLWAGMRMTESAPARWFVRWGWALLVPVVAVQLYGVYVRLSAYGLTPLRYASLACTAVGIVGLALAAAGKGPRQLCLLAAVAAIVVLVSPANALDMAYLDQARCLRENLELVQGGGEVPKERWERVAGAWVYLRGADRGFQRDDHVDDVVAQLTSDAAFERTFGFEPPLSMAQEEPSYRYVWATAERGAVDVAGFSKAYELADLITQGYAFDEGGSVSVALDAGDGGLRTLDLTDLAHQALAGTLPGEPSDDDGWQLPEGGVVIDLDDGSRAVIMGLGVDAEGDRPTDMWVEGYLLVP